MLLQSCTDLTDTGKHSSAYDALVELLTAHVIREVTARTEHVSHKKKKGLELHNIEKV